MARCARPDYGSRQATHQDRQRGRDLPTADDLPGGRCCRGRELRSGRGGADALPSVRLGRRLPRPDAQASPIRQNR